jgi:hypothetical protein
MKSSTVKYIIAAFVAITVISAVIDIATSPASEAATTMPTKGATTKYLSEAEGDLFTFYRTHPTFAQAGYACQSKRVYGEYFIRCAGVGYEKGAIYAYSEDAQEYKLRGVSSLTFVAHGAIPAYDGSVATDAIYRAFSVD